MWARLVGLTRVVAIVAWTVLVVGFAPSATWAAGDNSSETSPPAPTGPDTPDSSSPPQSPADPPDTSSSTSEPSPSPDAESTDEPLVVLLDAEQLETILTELRPLPADTAPVTQAPSAGSLTLETDQWESLTGHLTALVLGAALTVAALFARTISGWGRRD